MSWTVLNTTDQPIVYCWFPGWSFSAKVFSPIYQQLPGCHLGADYIAAGSLENYALTLANNLNQHCIPQTAKKVVFIGWSLGGALAHHCLAKFSEISDMPVALLTLATGERFIQEPEISEQGMDQETFMAFSANLEKFPAKTAKRFLGLCTQHADNAREQMRQLASTQITDENILIRSLAWLNYEKLPQVSARQQHWYSEQDGFNPRQLKPAFCSSEKGHGFFLTQSGQKELLSSVQTLLLQLTQEEL